MALRLAVALLVLTIARAAAQQPAPLFNASPLPPPSPAGTPPASPSPIPDQSAPVPATAPAPAPTERVFCDQSVAAQPADPQSVPENYRPFIGIFSDAAWNPQTCAALIVEGVAPDGTATITYAFGPMSSATKMQGGVLHGTGVVKDGALLFQNNDGSQYAFRPFYSDLSGKWTTPKGQTYETIFKRSF